MLLLSLAISSISVVACAWLGTLINKTVAYYFVTDSNTYLAVMTGVSAFLFFKNIKINYSRFINTVAASTFGVLLIHGHSDSMRQWLWQDVLNNVGMYDSTFLVLHAIGSVVGIFTLCTIIDQLRIRFIEIPFFYLWDRKWERFTTWFTEKENIICKKLGIEL